MSQIFSWGKRGSTNIGLGRSRGCFCGCSSRFEKCCRSTRFSSFINQKTEKNFAVRFQRFDSLLAQLKVFTNFEGKSIEDYGITEPDYEEYAAHYRNVIEELRNDRDNGDGDDDEENEDIRQKKLDEIREYIQEKGQNESGTIYVP